MWAVGRQVYKPVVCATILLMCDNHYQPKFVNMADDVVCMSWRFLHHGSIL